MDIKNEKAVINDKDLENVTGGCTIKPKDGEMWYSYNPFAYNWGDNWGDEGYFGNN